MDKLPHDEKDISMSSLFVLAEEGYKPIFEKAARNGFEFKQISEGRDLLSHCVEHSQYSIADLILEIVASWAENLPHSR